MSEYESFSKLLTRIISVPHTEIAKREAEYKRQAALNPHKRGPKPKKKPIASGRAPAA